MLIYVYIWPRHNKLPLSCILTGRGGGGFACLRQTRTSLPPIRFANVQSTCNPYEIMQCMSHTIHFFRHSEVDREVYNETAAEFILLVIIIIIISYIKVV